MNFSLHSLTFFLANSPAEDLNPLPADVSREVTENASAPSSFMISRVDNRPRAGQNAYPVSGFLPPLARRDAARTSSECKTQHGMWFDQGWRFGVSTSP